MPSTTDGNTSQNHPASNGIPSLNVRLNKMVFSLQFLWFIGHLTTVFHALYCLLAPQRSDRSYAKALYGVILSYCIILYKSHGTPLISKAYLMRILMDENTHYLILALLWLTLSKPIAVALIPFAIFSFFHSLTYIRAHLIPVLFPLRPSSSAAASSNNEPNAQPPTVNDRSANMLSLSRKVSQWIGSFVNKYQSKALLLVCQLEVLFILPYLILYLFTGTSSLVSIIVFVQFLRFRFYFSKGTQEAFKTARTYLDNYIERNPKMPLSVRQYYIKIREWIQWYGESALIPGKSSRPETDRVR